MKTINSLSGGRTSAYMAAMFPADYDLFALVRTSDINCQFPDATIRRIVEDRIQKPFVGTLEDDTIIYTMLDLEQFLGREITWVSGLTFDEVVQNKGGWLPNKLHRYCTTHMNIEPMFYWWAEHIGELVEMRIGYRANEGRRVRKMQKRLNENGLMEFEATFGKNSRDQNKWETVAWQKPVWPLAHQLPTWADGVQSFWHDKPVRFARLNNCVGCFHRNPALLRLQWDKHPEKMDWFMGQERTKQAKYGEHKATWRKDVTYERIKERPPIQGIDFEDFSECDSGYCGL